MQKLDPRKPLPQSVDKIARHYLVTFIELLEEQRTGFDDAIHKARRSMKRLRALLKLVESLNKPALVAIRKDVAAAARSLSERRDAAALVECTRKLGKYLESRQAGDMAAPLTEALEKRRDLLVLEAASPAELVGPAVAAARKALRDIEKTKLSTRRETASVLADGRSKNHDKARDVLKDCRHGGEPEAFHELRKCAQTTVFQAGFLQAAWPFAFKAEAEQAARIAEILGHEHDIEVLNILLHSEPHLFGAIADKDRLAELLMERRAALRHDTIKIAQSLYAESGRHEARRLRALWQTAQRGGR